MRDEKKNNEAGQKQALPTKIASQVKSEFPAFRQADLSDYTYDKRHSDFKDAKSDLTVYNGVGTVVLHGRDFGSRTFFWQP